MKRKSYEKPTIRIVKLQPRKMLMASGETNRQVQATMNTEWEEEDI